MDPDFITQINLQLEDLERKMLNESASRCDFLKKIHTKQLDAAKNLLHYLVLRKEDVRELQDALHIAGLSSLASSESHIHSQLQSILMRLGKNYSPDELDNCDYLFSKKEIGR